VITLAVALWFGWIVCVTGPAFDGRRAARAARRDLATARVLYLPSGVVLCESCWRQDCRLSHPA
jgi:hypothetical protein